MKKKTRLATRRYTLNKKQFRNLAYETSREIRKLYNIDTRNVLLNILIFNRVLL